MFCDHREIFIRKQVMKKNCVKRKKGKRLLLSGRIIPLQLRHGSICKVNLVHVSVGSIMSL